MKPYLAIIFVFLSITCVAQTNDQGSTYHSEIDDLVTIDKVSYASFLDNLGGIYARPLEAHFAQVIGEMHRWSSEGTVGIGGATLEELEENPQKVKDIAASSGADGFFAAKIIKGPKGISMRLDFFLTKDGKLFLQEEIKDFQQFDLNILKEHLDDLLSHLIRRIPYSGRVLSRDLNRVTVNIGSRDGVEIGRVVSVIQIIKLNRHPKFSFLISVDKEIIGKIKILKVDDTLSFGSVVMEKERGTVQKGGKLDSLEFVSYNVNDAALGAGEASIDQRPDAPLAFGKDAKAWKPQEAPTLGQVGARFGFSRFTEKTDLSTGSITGTDNTAVLAEIDSELWLTQSWTLHATLRHGIIAVSSPQSISESLSAYEMLIGYKFRFGPSIWSPYAEPFIGYTTYRLYADAVTPSAFDTMQYNGIKIGLQGGTPVTADDLWSVGGRISFIVSPSLSETPYSSGSSSTNNINQFTFWGARKITEHWKAQLDLEYELYTSSFSGGGTRPSSVTAATASQEYMTLLAGIYYLF